MYLSEHDQIPGTDDYDSSCEYEVAIPFDLPQSAPGIAFLAQSRACLNGSSRGCSRCQLYSRGVSVGWPQNKGAMNMYTGQARLNR